MVKIIFMIDDDQDDREIFQEALYKCNPNLQFLFAVDGEDALQRLQSTLAKPDAIFLDYNMPRMNGVECLRKLKASADTKDIPVVMYTTSGDPEEEKVLMFLGASYYMKKTTSFDQLCIELNGLLDEFSEKRHSTKL